MLWKHWEGIDKFYLGLFEKTRENKMSLHFKCLKDEQIFRRWEVKGRIFQEDRIT